MYKLAELHKGISQTEQGYFATILTNLVYEKEQGLVRELQKDVKKANAVKRRYKREIEQDVSALHNLVIFWHFYRH